MDWQYWFYASAALNVLLGITLFFKSALNDIASHWFKTRFIGRREKRRELLVELSGHMHSIDRNYLIAVAQVLVPGGASSLPQTEAGAALTSVNRFIDQHTVELPPAIRTLVTELQRAMVLQGFPNIHRDQLLEAARAVQDATARIRQEIEHLIG